MSSANGPSTPPKFFSQQIRKARRFYLDLAPSPDEPLAVVCGGQEFCARNYAIARLTFPYYSIEFVAKGAGSVLLDGREHRLGSGAVFSYGPGVAHEITTDPEDLLEKYFVDFTGVRALQLLTQCGLPPGVFARTSAIGEVQEILTHLIRDGLRGTAISGSLCAVLFEYLALKLADSILPADSRQTPAFATFQRCRDHIARHFLRLKSLEQTADECEVDRAYLCRLFRRFDRQSPYQYLMRLKMNWASERLHNPDLLIRHVAAELGFRDPYHFSHAFKSVFGLSPAAFRRLR